MLPNLKGHLADVGINFVQAHLTVFMSRFVNLLCLLFVCFQTYNPFLRQGGHII